MNTNYPLLVFSVLVLAIFALFLIVTNRPNSQLTNSAPVLVSPSPNPGTAAEVGNFQEVNGQMVEVSPAE